MTHAKPPLSNDKQSLMQRVLVGSIAAGIVLFLWGCAAWLFLPTYTNFRDILDEEAVVRTLGETLPDRGVYYFPKHPDSSADSVADWNKKVSIGPTGLVVFNPQGHGALGVQKFLAAFIIQWIAALLAAVLLSMTLPSRPTYKRRWLFVFLIGCITSMVAYLPDLIWYGFPEKYVFNLMRDMIIGWSLAGLVLAFFIKTRQQEKEEMKLEEKIKSEVRAKLHTEHHKSP